MGPLSPRRAPFSLPVSTTLNGEITIHERGLWGSVAPLLLAIVFFLPCALVAIDSITGPGRTPVSFWKTLGLVVAIDVVLWAIVLWRVLSTRTLRIDPMSRRVSLSGRLANRSIRAEEPIEKLGVGIRPVALVVGGMAGEVWEGFALVLNVGTYDFVPCIQRKKEEVCEYLKKLPDDVGKRASESPHLVLARYGRCF